MAVQQFNLVGQRLETMGKAFRNQQRVAVIRRQAFTMPLQIGRGADSQVHGQIPHLTPDAVHQFHLGMGRALIVQATHRAAPGRVGMVDLRDRLAPSRRAELFGAKQARQEAAGISQMLALNQLQAGQRQRRDRETAHGRASKAANCASHRARASAPWC